MYLACKRYIPLIIQRDTCMNFINWTGPSRAGRITLFCELSRVSTVDCPVRMNISYRDNYGGILKLPLVRKVGFAIYSLHIIIILTENSHDDKSEKQRKQQKVERSKTKQRERVKGGMRRPPFALLQLQITSRNALFRKRYCTSIKLCDCEALSPCLLSLFSFEFFGTAGGLIDLTPP